MLARWTFFNPAILSVRTDFIKQLQSNSTKSKDRKPKDPPPSSSGKGGLHEHVTLSHGRMTDFIDHLAEIGCAEDSKGVSVGVSMIQVVHQYHGNKVCVLPGHMHQVENLQGCTKVDCDRYMLAELSQCAMSWLRSMPHVDSVPDCMAVNKALLYAILIFTNGVAADRNCEQLRWCVGH